MFQTKTYMSEALPQIYLVRHGETAWSLSGQHTGLTDIPLTEKGEKDAQELKERLKNISFEAVFCSPLKRAKQTCELAGFGSAMIIEPDLREWNYGDYEGLTTAEIQKRCPDWNIFRDGCPGGESVLDVRVRADRLLARVKSTKQQKTLLVSHGHMLRVLATSWLGLEIKEGGCFYVSPTSISILGYDHNLSEATIHLWNDVS